VAYKYAAYDALEHMKGVRPDAAAKPPLERVS
jgi:hypothetical protein